MKHNIIEAKRVIKGHQIDPVFEVPIFSGRRSEVLEIVTGKMNKKAVGKPLFVVTLNTEMLTNSIGDKTYKQVLLDADLLIPDSNGLRVLGVKHVYAGRKLVEDLLLMKKYRVFYTGGFEGVVDKMISKYGGFGDENIEDPKIITKINKYKPDLLLVAFGGGVKQEKWIHSRLKSLKAKVVIGVGGTFDTLTGKIKLPPTWMEKIGLEWLWRLIQQPWRIKRQIKLLQFLQIVWRRRK